MKKIKQADKILAYLLRHKNEWVNGRYFNNTMMISQYHARIFELQEQKYKIVPSPFTDKYGFKSYMLIEK